MNRVGFTGSQHGITEAQLASLREILTSLIEDSVLHHGDCVGADATADSVWATLGRPKVVHPPTDDRKQAHVQRSHPLDEWRDAKPYLKRNHDIVDESDFLISCPRVDHEEVRSGTWATVRYARKQYKPVITIWPDGRY